MARAARIRQGELKARQKKNATLTGARDGGLRVQGWRSVVRVRPRTGAAQHEAFVAVETLMQLRTQARADGG